jgi:flagellin
MAMTINTNVASLNARRYLSGSQALLQKSLSRLSSGLRINGAKDDAAGLAISDRMTAQIRGLDQAVRNANDGISLSQTAEGALQEASSILQRMRELAVQSANDTNSATDRSNLQKEVSQLQQELNRIANNTEFNGQKLLDGSFISKAFQVGANSFQTINVTVKNARADKMGINKVLAEGPLNNAAAKNASYAAISTTDVGAGEDLTITGTIGDDLVAVSAGDTAKEIAESVNASTASTGVEADAVTFAQLSTLGTSGNLTFTLHGGGSSVISVIIDDKNDLTALAEEINNKAGTTQITATLSSDKNTVTLYNSEGYNIGIEDVTISTAGASIVFQGLKSDGTTTAGASQALISGGADSSMVGGSLIFKSSESFTVKSGAAGDIFASTSTTGSSLSNVGSIDIGTQSGANAALDVIDGALDFIANIRADLGAVQNRFESTISNLQSVSENLASSRSRILDADFAAETADLTKSQILIQAGTAMLAQANQLPQQVLALIQL